MTTRNTSVVDVGDSGAVNFSFDNASVTEQLNYIKEYITAAQAALFGDVDEGTTGVLQELADTLVEYVPDIDTDDLTEPSLDPPNEFPPVQSWVDNPLSLNENWPEDLPTEPVFLPYGNLDFDDWVEPTRVEEISSNFNWSASTYSSEMWTELFTRVHNDIIEGGNGLSQAVYDAIVAREQEARRINQEREYRQAIDGAGSQGFDLPSGHIAALQVEITRERLKQDQDAVNNLLIKDFDLATNNTQFAVTTGAELEKLLRGTFEAAEQRGLEAERAASDYIIAVYNANIQRYIAEWEGVKTELEALKVKVEAIAARNESEVKVYIGEVEAYKTEVEAIASENTAKISVRAAEIDAYRAEIEAAATKYNAFVEEAKIELETYKTQVALAIDDEKLAFEAKTTYYDLRERITESIANISAQIMASALGAINASVTNQYSASERRGETWGHSDGVTEGHTFNHTSTT